MRYQTILQYQSSVGDSIKSEVRTNMDLNHPMPGELSLRDVGYMVNLFVQGQFDIAVRY